MLGSDFLDRGLITVQNFALEVMMGARNNDAVSIMNKIGFAEDFTESVASGVADYNGSVQANAIKDILLNVSHESKDSDFAALISSYASQYAPSNPFKAPEVPEPVVFEAYDLYGYVQDVKDGDTSVEGEYENTPYESPIMPTTSIENDLSELLIV